MKKTFLNFGLIAQVLFVLLISLNSITGTINEELFPHSVETLNGPVQGIIGKSRNESNSYVAFVGLRYAAPPGRFEPPHPFKENWITPKIANTPGNACPQYAEDGSFHEDEDCLFLNVYVPKTHLEKGESKLPVMVWIHGGGFAFGDGYNYRPDYYMENGGDDDGSIVLVTINYRLGALGYLSMEDDTLIANNGLRDQVMALRWVRDNIGAFKGDSGNVVLFGNSAGSSSIHYLLMSPMAKGLFHKAIMQSGAFSFWSYSPNPKEMAVKFATNLGCRMTSNETDISREIRTCLEGKSVKELLRAQAEFHPRWPTANSISRFLPTAKESKSTKPFFANSPHSYFMHGQGKTSYASKVPVIIGTTKNEGSTLFTAFVFSDKRATDQLNMKWHQYAPKTFCYDSFYPPETHARISTKLRQFYFGKAQQFTLEASADTLSIVYSDALFTLPVMAAATEMAREGMTVWPYVFSFAGTRSLRNAFNLTELPGMVGHADELQYSFPHNVLGPPLEQGSIEEKFSRLFVKFWIHFAKNGEPAQEFVKDGEELNWKPIQKTSKNNINLEVLRILTKPKVGKFEFYDRIQFWRDLTGESYKSVKNSKTEL